MKAQTLKDYTKLKTTKGRTISVCVGSSKNTDYRVTLENYNGAGIYFLIGRKMYVRAGYNYRYFATSV